MHPQQLVKTMFKKNTSNNAVPKSAQTDDDAPWSRAGKEFEDRTLRQQAQVRNWRMFAFLCLAVATFAVGGMAYIGSQSKFVPFLVEVDKLGRTLAVRTVGDKDSLADPAKLQYRELFELIENLRTVTTDIAANNKHIDDGFSRLRGAAANYVRTELRKAPPNEVGTTKTVQVKVKTAFPISGQSNTWQIEWEEHSYDLNGDPMMMERWKASVNFDMQPSEDEDVFRKNPMGFFVDNLNWAKVI